MHANSINQRRGINAKIHDRWDLTMECIRRYYAGEDSPIQRTLERDKNFFDLFVDFKGYVDYFFLNDCVSEDYSSVNIWLGKSDFSSKALPQTVEDYFLFLERQDQFLEKRRARMNEFIKANKL